MGTFRRPRRLRGDEELDPVGGAATNLLDLMLVFACGLLLALVLSWNLQDVFFQKLPPAERQRLLQAVRRVVTVERGKELGQVPPVEEGGGSGYREVGTVYVDPQTGRLIMVEKGK